MKPVWWISLLLMIAWPGGAGGQTNLDCIVCGKNLLQTYVQQHRWGLVCAECSQLETRCSLCGLPIKVASARTADGRLICRFDLPNVVLAAGEAQEMFKEIQEELERLTSGSLHLRSTNITVQLFDVDYWSRSGIDSGPVEQRQVGFAMSRPVNGEFIHLVGLLSGRPKTEVKAACAHEFTHLWIQENTAKSRQLEKDTVEALCELVAYKYVGWHHDSALEEFIRINPYTHGMILILIDAEMRGGLDTILDWVKTGTGAKFTPEALALFRSEAAASAARIIAVPRASAVPSTLILRGISGSVLQREALINDRTFHRNEEKNVRVGPQIVRVRCLDIGDQAVIVRVEDAPIPTTLTIGHH
jgi:hypothetical protein